jgi:polyhydroxybutyrate depolymerase
MLAFGIAPLVITLCYVPPAPPPGDYLRSLRVGDLARSYYIHIPPKYDAARPTPLVVVFHGAGMNGAIMMHFSGLNEKADAASFVAVYPNGTGVGDAFLTWTWNAGGKAGLIAQNKADDVAFTKAVLADVVKLIHVDGRRVYAVGMSNGGMMAHRVGVELADRIAAVAAVAGPLALGRCNPCRPVPILHFHGTKDPLIPIEGPTTAVQTMIQYRPVEEAMKAWAVADGCTCEPTVTELPQRVQDGTKVRRKNYGTGKDGAEVVLYEIEGGGHTWPGRPAPVPWIGRPTRNIEANDLIWEFFQKHSLK